MNQSARRIPILFAIAAFLAAILAFPASAMLVPERSGEGSAPSGDATIVPNHYIVVFKDSVDHPGALAETQAEQRDGELGFVYRHALKGYSAELSKDDVKALRSDPRVRYVAPDRYVSVQEEEVELETEDGEGIEVSEATIPTGIKRALATANKALDIDGVDDVRIDADVAVIDTGIDSTHPDLDVEARTSCITGTCIDNTGTDGNSHGTHVAGTVGAIDNGQGVVGIAPGARLWAVKVLNESGFGQQSWIAAGVDWVTAHAKEIEVANMSLGCLCPLPAVDTAINKSVEAGVVYVVAAGNSSVDAKNFNPASNPNAITVSALADYDGKSGGLAEPTCFNYGKDDTLATFSNYGTAIEIAAPGVCTLSTTPGNAYGYKSGTSMASPHVAGAAAFLASKSNPNDKAAVEAIRATLIKEGTFNWTDTSADGVQEPLLFVGGFPPPTATTEAASSVKGTTATLNGTVNPKGSSTTYQFEYGTTTSYGTKVPVSPKSVGSGTSNVKVSVPISGLKANTTYHFRVVASNEAATIPGKDETFTTLSLPSVTTQAASPILMTGATLNGTVNPKGSSTTYQFEYGTTTSYGSKVPPSPKAIGSGTSNVAVSEPIGGLKANTTYHFRVVASSEAGTVNGEDLTFTTSVVEPPKFQSAFGSYGSGNGQFIDSSSVAIDSAGNLWVVDTYNHRVQKFNSEGTYLSQFGASGSGNGQFNTPEDLVIDASGNLWVVDVGNNRVQKFNSEGKYLSQFGSAGIGNGQLKHPSGIAIDSKGNLWVADRENHRIQRFNSEGKYLSQFGSNGSGNGQFNGPRGLAIDASGSIWVADYGNHRIQKFNSEGKYLSQFGSKGSGNSQFNLPVDIAIDPKGNLWVTDSGNHRIQEFNSEGKFLTQFGSQGSGEGQFFWPHGITADPEGNLWVADLGNNRVQKWNAPVSAPTFSFAFGAKGAGNGQFNSPKGLVIDSSSNVLVVDAINDRVQKFNSKGEYLSQFGSTGSGNGQFLSPCDVAVDSSGNIWVLGDNRVQKFNSKGEYLSQFGSFGEGNGQFKSPRAIAIDSKDNLWVADMGRNRVQKFNSKGEYLSQFGTEGTGNGQFKNPEGIAIDPFGNVWVADTYNNRVQEFNSEGKYLSQFGAAGSGDGQFSAPAGIEADAKGNLWIVDRGNNRVQAFNPEGKYLVRFGSFGSGSGQFSAPVGVAIDAAGNLWISDSGNNRVQKWGF